MVREKEKTQKCGKTKFQLKATTELASKQELFRKVFEKTVCLPNTDIYQATRTEFTFAISQKNNI